MGSPPSVAAASAEDKIMKEDSMMEGDNVMEEDDIGKKDNIMKQDTVDIAVESGETASDNVTKDDTVEVATESNDAASGDAMKENTVGIAAESGEAASEQTEPLGAGEPATGEEELKHKKNKKSKKKNKKGRVPMQSDGMGCHIDECCDAAAKGRWAQLAKSMEDEGIVADQYNVQHPMEVIPNLMRHFDKASGTNNFTRSIEVNVKGSWKCTACHAVSTFVNAPAMSWNVHERPSGLALKNDTVSTADYYGHEFKQRKNDLCKACGMITEHACTLETHLGGMMYINIVPEEKDKPAPTITIEHEFPDAEHKDMSWQFGVCILFHDTHEGDRHMTNVKLRNGQLLHVDMESQTTIKYGSDLRKLKVHGADTIRVALVMYNRLRKTGASKGTVCFLSGPSA